MSWIDSAIAKNKVMVFSKSSCPYCGKTKELLKQKGVQFGLIELDQLPDGEARQNALQKKTGQRTVPNIFIYGKHIGGNSELHALNKKGQLDELFPFQLSTQKKKEKLDAISKKKIDEE